MCTVEPWLHRCQKCLTRLVSLIRVLTTAGGMVVLTHRQRQCQLEEASTH